MKRSSGWNQEVTDAQGRRRFHGAFTGGFSAGHFNTVGSEEGWTPSTFVSSRTSRTSVAPRRAEDFMDEEDDPLLGKQLETSEAFDTLHHNEKARRLEAAANKESKPPIFQVPDELILPMTGDSIGKKLMSRMGWKDGHGIGPRMRRRKLSIGSDNEETKTDNEKQGNEEVYVPPRNTVSAKIFPKPKTDKYGAGFDPYVNAPEFRLHKLKHDDQQLKPERQVVTFAQALGSGTNSSSRVAMGFGLSALEENDDLDVYGTSSMDDFDRAIAPASESIKLLDSISSVARDKKHRDTHESTTVLCSDGRPALKGFRIASKRQKPPKNVIERLGVPANFRAYHVFNEKEEAEAVASLYGKYNFSTEKGGRGSMMAASQRAQMLNDEPITGSSGVKLSSGSVFDLLDPAQRDKLKNAAQAARERVPQPSAAPTEQFRANIMASISKRFVSASSTEDTSTERQSKPIVPVEKKSYRSEDAWAPHVLLCKRFHVKCEGQTISGGAQGDDNVQDLFTTELAPHLMDLAASRRSTKGEHSSSISPLPNAPSVQEEELPPLPTVPKPSTDLLRSIFEPSDESDLEEDERSDDVDKDSDSDHKGVKEKVEPTTMELPVDFNSKPVEATTANHKDRPHVSSGDSESSEDSENSEDSETEKRRHSRKHKSKKHKKKHHRKSEYDDDRRGKHKKSSRKDVKKDKKEKKAGRESERSSRRARSRSRDRSRGRDRSRSRRD